VFRHLQTLCQDGIRDGTPRASQAGFQFVEYCGFAVRFVFVLQLAIHQVEQCQRPVLLEESFGSERIHWFASESSFRVAGVQRDDLSAAALLRASLVPLVHQKMIQGREEKRTEFSFLARDGAEGVLFHQPREELLREVLGVVRRRSEERRVGKEWRSRWAREHDKEE